MAPGFRSLKDGISIDWFFDIGVLSKKVWLTNIVKIGITVMKITFYVEIPVKTQLDVRWVTLFFNSVPSCKEKHFGYSMGEE